MSIIRSAAKYSAITRINLQSALAYFWDVSYRSIFMLIIMYVFIQLWSTAYAGGSSIAGFTLRDTIWYLVIAETIILGKQRVITLIGDEVKSGTLAYTLNRPVNYLLYHFFAGLGEAILRMAVTFVAGAAITLLLIGLPPVAFWQMPFVLVAMFLALTLDFAIAAALGLMAFFTEDVNSLAFVYQKFLFILGGMLIPLDFFPAWLRNASLALPFNFIVYAPARLFVKFDWPIFAQTIGMQVVWLVILGLITAGIFAYGVRRLSINGG